MKSANFDHRFPLLLVALLLFTVACSLGILALLPKGGLEIQILPETVIEVTAPDFDSTPANE